MLPSRRGLAAVLISASALAGGALTSPALAEDTCRSDVTAAFDKQRAAKSFRMEANVIGPQGPMRMTIDYGLPDRIRQKVLMMLEQKTIEAVLVGKDAWLNEGQGWGKAPGEVSEELSKQLASVAEETADQMVQFECMGRVQLDGRELAAYRAKEGPGKGAAPAVNPTGTMRVIYIDPGSGLPARSVVAQADKLDRPLFKADYSYPTDIKIEPPM